MTVVFLFKQKRHGVYNIYERKSGADGNLPEKEENV